jgi:hypothetical protein
VTPYARPAAILGLDLFPKIRTAEKIIEEERLGGSNSAGQSTRDGHNWTSDLICLGRWRQVA